MRNHTSHITRMQMYTYFPHEPGIAGCPLTSFLHLFWSSASSNDSPNHFVSSLTPSQAADAGTGNICYKVKISNVLLWCAKMIQSTMKLHAKNDIKLKQQTTNFKPVQLTIICRTHAWTPTWVSCTEWSADESRMTTRTLWKPSYLRTLSTVYTHSATQCVTVFISWQNRLTILLLSIWFNWDWRISQSKRPHTIHYIVSLFLRKSVLDSKGLYILYLTSDKNVGCS